MKKYTKFIPYFTTLGVMIVIFMFSAESAEKSAESSSGFIQFIINIFNNLFNSEHSITITNTIEHFVRKTAHFCIYGLLGFNAYWLFLWNCKNTKKHMILLFSVILSFIYACSDEIHQLFSPGRSGSFGDVLLDTSGAFCGALALIVIIFIYTHLKEKKVNK